MTIIASYRMDDKALFVADFRVSTKENNVIRKQMDFSLKFHSLDNKLGLFMSGDVHFWKHAIPKIDEVISKVNINNVLDISSPLWQNISSVAIKHKGGKAGAICFFINESKEKNIQFNIEIEPGKGCKIKENKNFEAIILGSGRYLPNIKERINNSVEKCRKIDYIQDDLYKLSGCIQNEIKNSLVECGSSSFKKLGISPCFATASLEKGSFCIYGTEIEGLNLSDRKSISYNYSFDETRIGNIALKDYVKDNIQIINNIFEISKESIGIIFDPEGLTIGDDPSKLFPNDNYIYQLDQSIIPFHFKFNKSYQILRIVKKIDFITEKRLCQETNITSDVLNVSFDELNNYKHNRSYFSFDERNEMELSKSSLFNHDFWKKIIDDYFNFYENT